MRLVTLLLLAVVVMATVSAEERCPTGMEPWTIVGGGFHMQLTLPLCSSAEDVRFAMKLNNGLFFDLEEVRHRYAVLGTDANGQVVDVTTYFGALDVVSDVEFDIEIPIFRCTHEDASVTLALTKIKELPEIGSIRILVPLHARYQQALHIPKGASFNWPNFLFGTEERAYAETCITDMHTSWRGRMSGAGSVTSPGSLCLNVPSVFLDILPTVHYALLSILWIGALIVATCFIAPRMM